MTEREKMANEITREAEALVYKPDADALLRYAARIRARGHDGSVYQPAYVIHTPPAVRVEV